MYVHLAFLFITLLGLQKPRFIWQKMPVESDATFRAIHTLNDGVCWIGGSGGALLRTTNGGKSWEKIKIPNADSLDFRGVHAFSADTAVVMSAGEARLGKAKIFLTNDGGKSWLTVFNTTKDGVFLDGIAFWNRKEGIALGDPINGHFYLLITQDGGQSWQILADKFLPHTKPNEAAFAASGTSLVVDGDGRVLIGASGGTKTRILASNDYAMHWAASEVPLASGSTSGIFGLCIMPNQKVLALGGGYKNYLATQNNLLLSQDNGKSWLPRQLNNPPGLKEAAVYFGRYWLVVGHSGSSFSDDQGDSWNEIDGLPFHTVSNGDSLVFAAGANGLVARLILPN